MRLDPGNRLGDPSAWKSCKVWTKLRELCILPTGATMTQLMLTVLEFFQSRLIPCRGLGLCPAQECVSYPLLCNNILQTLMTSNNDLRFLLQVLQSSCQIGLLSTSRSSLGDICSKDMVGQHVSPQGLWHWEPLLWGCAFVPQVSSKGSSWLGKICSMRGSKKKEKTRKEWTTVLKFLTIWKRERKIVSTDLLPKYLSVVRQLELG